MLQSISYLLDVWRGVIPASHTPLNYAAYKAMFAQLIAGPIVRYATVAGELAARQHSLAQFGRGGRRFMVGLCMKVVVADTLAPLVDAVFALPRPSLADGWLGAAGYTLQLYFDFAGYSAMAIGLALMIGLHFPENFRDPYLAGSIQAFWQRWHITLSSFLRDYLYIPLGGSRRGVGRTYANLLLTMLIGGLWHGANWTFVAWGGWHGVLLALHRLYRSRGGRMPLAVGHALTLLAVVLGWVLFRADSFAGAAQLYRGMFGLHGAGITDDLAWQATPDRLWMVAVAAAVIYLPALRPFWPGGRVAARVALAGPLCGLLLAVVAALQPRRGAVPVLPVLSRRADRLYGWLMAAALLAGAGEGVATLASPEARRHVAAAATWAALLSGQTAAAINDAMAHDLPGGGMLRAAGGVLRWRLFGSGGPQVTVGCGGWLYLTEELRPWPGGEAAMQRRALLLHQIAADLAAKGITLQLVLVPDKARIATEGACGLPRSAQAQDRYATFAAMLEGLPVTDLVAAYTAVRTPLYYRTDTHWNEDGAALAAAAVAAATDAPIDRDHPFRTRYGPAAKRPGDLLRLMGLDQVPDFAIALRPRPDEEPPATTSEAEPPGLLDEVPPPDVVLIGSSYSLNGNFLGALEQSLAAPVAQYARAGGGFWEAAHDYFRSPAFTAAPPKLVVWEIPERVVNQPIGEQEAAFLRNWRGP